MFNDNVEERYALAIERIKEIAEEPGLKTDGFADYFKCIATFILKMMFSEIIHLKNIRI